MKSFGSLFSPSILLGISAGFIMYISYAIGHNVWGNYFLILVCIFIGYFIPMYSKLSNKIDEKICFYTGVVTYGRIGRFIAQFIFNLFIFLMFIYGDVFASEKIMNLGGVLGISFLTTLASQGIQYIALVFSNREIGDKNRNILIGLVLNIVITSLATLGYTNIQTFFMLMSFIFGSVLFLVGILSDLRAIYYPRKGIGIFFGTFNPFHITHIDLIKRLINERKVTKVYLHSTVIPKLHRDALSKKEIYIHSIKEGRQIYKKTTLADRYVNYFPTGNEFFEYETRLEIMRKSIKKIIKESL